MRPVNVLTEVSESGGQQWKSDNGSHLTIVDIHIELVLHAYKNARQLLIGLLTLMRCMSKVYEHAMKICVLFVFKLKVNGVQCCFGPQWFHCVDKSTLFKTSSNVFLLLNGFYLCGVMQNYPPHQKYIW